MTELFGFTYADRNVSGALHLKADFDSTYRGVYQRYVDKPLVSNIKFKSVIVDVNLSSDSSTYDTVSEYLCYKAGPVFYREVRIGSRNPTMDQSVLLALESKMKHLGVPFEALRPADHSNCNYDH